MIFYDHQAVFFHIGKAVGTAIEHWLAGDLPDPMIADRRRMFGWDPDEGIYLQHATIETMLRLAGPTLLHRFYKFSVVRNPFSRITSCFYYLYDTQHRQQFGDLARFVSQIPKIIEDPCIQRGAHVLPQVSYTHLCGDLFCYDVCHFENLPKSLTPVREALLLASLPPRSNNARSQAWPDLPIAELFSPVMRRIVQDIYEDDFRAFGYSASPEILDPHSSDIAAQLGT